MKNTIMTREKAVGTLTGGNGFTLEEAEGFCAALHADAAIEYRDGIVTVMAIRVPEVN